jgi:hypothetical protein
MFSGRSKSYGGETLAGVLHRSLAVVGQSDGEGNHYIAVGKISFICRAVIR